MAKNKRKKGKKKNANTKPKQTNNTPEVGQVVSQEHSEAKKTQIYTTDNSKKTYLGLKSKTWSIILLLSVLVSFIVFLIVPYTIGLILSAQKNSVDDFLSKINGFTIFLSIVGTVASIWSIIMTFLDKQRYSDEKKHSEQLFSEVKTLGTTLLNVGDNIKMLKEENEKLSLEVHDLKDEVSISKEIIEANLRDWKDRNEAREKD